MLDGNRFRESFAAIAGARLGRSVVIGGQVTLRLLPEVVLTASDVTLPDQGDGISARLGTLRLQVAPMPLLAGRIVARDLVLGAPVLHLPWPLPAGFTHPVRPLVPRGFRARIEGGLLSLGGVAVTAVTGSLASDPVTGALAASGSAVAGGNPWHVEAKLGAADAEGHADFGLRIQGQDRLRDTRGVFSGSVSGNLVRGDLDLAGGDLSALAPSPAIAWHIRGPADLSAGRIEAGALVLGDGKTPAQARMVLTLAEPAHLDADIVAAVIDARSWLPALTALPTASVPIRLGLTAASIIVPGGMASDTKLALTSGDGPTRIDRLEASLPGGAHVTANGVLAQSGLATEFTGPARLEAPDLLATLAWLRPFAPALADAAGGRLTRARLAGTASLQPGRLAIAGLSGSVDGVALSGNLAATIGARPSVSGDLRLASLVLDSLPPFSPLSLVAHGWPDQGYDADIRLESAAVHAGDRTATAVVLDAREDASGFQIRRLEAEFSGAHLAASGTLGVGVGLAAGRLDVTTKDLASVADALPPNWRPALKRLGGPASLSASASGPAGALDLQIGADAGDLRMEAEDMLDTRSLASSITVTLRHPGVPRLLAGFGIPDADAWLGTGSLAVLAHARATPGRLVFDDVDLRAATLHLGGRAFIDMSAAVPEIEAAIDGDVLALPAWSSLRTLPIGSGWTDGASWTVHLRAKQVLAGLRPVMDDLDAETRIEQGILVASQVTATVLNGRIAGQAAMDLAHTPPRFSLQGTLDGASSDDRLTGLPVDVAAASFDLSADVAGEGRDMDALAAALQGDLHLTVRDATVTGLDLSALATAMSAHGSGRDAALHSGITSGQSAGLGGHFDASLGVGRLTLAGASVAGPGGALDIAGWLDPAHATADLRLTVRPDAIVPSPILVTLTGGWTFAKRTDDLSKVPRNAPSKVSAKPKKHKPHHSS